MKDIEMVGSSGFHHLRDEFYINIWINTNAGIFGISSFGDEFYINIWINTNVGIFGISSFWGLILQKHLDKHQ
jgi:hypothetical protein